MLPQIKIYKIDYDFIISNYLDKNLWKKIWNLFVYKENVFTLNLYSIDTKNEKICFEIKYNKLQWSTQTIWYDIKNTSIDILKKQINGAIFRLMEIRDENLCKDSDGYYGIKEIYYDEEDKLREIAENYLDDNGITLDDVREVYIDKYVSDNRKMNIHLSNYVDAHRYRYLSELLLVFTKITDDEKRYKTIIEKIQDDTYVKYINSEVDAFKKFLTSDTYEPSMIDELESI